MKAVLVRKHGGLDVLEIADVPKPGAGPGQVVIEVKVAGMNHLDTWVRRGLPGVRLPLPMILGSDASGVVAEVGAGVAGLPLSHRDDDISKIRPGMLEVEWRRPCRVVGMGMVKADDPHHVDRH